jgi:hypothetical protein
MGKCLDVISGSRAALPSNICNKTTTDDKYRLLPHISSNFILRRTDERPNTDFAINPKFIHRINDAQESRHGLSFLSDFRLMDLKLYSIVFEVVFHLPAVDVVYV